MALPLSSLATALLAQDASGEQERTISEFILDLRRRTCELQEQAQAMRERSTALRERVRAMRERTRSMRWKL